MGGKGRKMIRKMQNATARMLTGRPILPIDQGPKLIGFDWLKRRMAKRVVGRAYEK